MKMPPPPRLLEVLDLVEHGEPDRAERLRRWARARDWASAAAKCEPPWDCTIRQYDAWQRVQLRWEGLADHLHAALIGALSMQAVQQALPLPPGRAFVRAHHGGGKP